MPLVVPVPVPAVALAPCDVPPADVVPVPVERFVIVSLLPPLRVKPIAIPAIAAAPSRAKAGPFHLTGGHLSGLADVAGQATDGI